MIANTAEVVGDKPDAGAFAHLADRWIYVFMAGLFVVTALVGFIPDSMVLLAGQRLSSLATVEAGQRPLLPLILHVHAIVMASWLLLLLAQTTLMAAGRSAQHKKLGLIAVVLAPRVPLAMIGIVKTVWSRIDSIPPGALTPDVLSGIKVMTSNGQLEDLRIIVLFVAFVSWALLVRRRDSETHKRLLILATLLPLPAAIDRITWIPTTLPDSPTSIHLGMLTLLLPVLIYDVWRRGRVHRAYVIGLALNVPFLVASQLLWGSPWWTAAVSKVMGSEAW